MEIQPFIDRMLEVENLTDNLEDKDAKRLLDWGIHWLPKALEGQVDADAAGDKANQLMGLLRKLNRLAPDGQSMSQDDIDEVIRQAEQVFGPRQAAAGGVSADLARLQEMDSSQILDYLLQLVTPQQLVEPPPVAREPGERPLSENTPPVIQPAQPEKKLSFFERLFGGRR